MSVEYYPEMRQRNSASADISEINVLGTGEDSWKMKRRVLWAASELRQEFLACM